MSFGMFGNIVHKLQSLSPLASPTTSPVNSPKPTRRRLKLRDKSRKRRLREEYREVQSEPELDYDSPSKCERSYVKKSSGTRTLLGGLDKIDQEKKALRKSTGTLTRIGLAIDTRTVGRSNGLKEAQRLVQYERFLQDIIRENNPELEKSSDERSKQRKEIERRGDLTIVSDLTRIQDLFPLDDLQLDQKDAFNAMSKMKGLMRKRSTTAARLQRAFSTKALKVSNDERPENESPVSYRNNNTQQPKRTFLLEAPVQFTTGVQTQERHLFLFNDLLLVAKARPGGNFKLKEKVKVSEMWLADSTCLEDVSEVSCPPAEVSFVMGWPIANVVATFSSPTIKELWWTELNRTIGEEMEKEPKSTPIQVLYYDSGSNVEYCKTVSVGRRETARSVAKAAAQSLDLPNATVVDPQTCQLWVRDEDSPYPLVGHERPLAIRMHALREAGFQSEHNQRLDHCNNVHTAGGQFILRNGSGTKSAVLPTPEPKVTKGSKKNRKSPLRLQKMFRRQKSDVTDSSGSSVSNSFTEGMLFGIPLPRLCDKENKIPQPIFALLHQLWLRGPLTQGIFRRSANARLVREVRERLDNGIEEDLAPLQPVVIASVFKEFLRSLPDPLLTSQLYPLWMEVADLPQQLKLNQVARLCSRLPPAHYNLLRHFLCVLYHIANHSSINMMSSANLGVCVGPSLLWGSNSGAHSAPVTPTNPLPTPMLAAAASRTVPSLVEFLIDHCPEVLGSSCTQLFGNSNSERETTSRQDSGAEESDSLHSSNGLRRDDSSIDSLERELLTEGENALPRKDKMSVTNLSRDSGLTMSDSQLYTPDEEEQSEDSSEKSHHAYPLPLLPTVYSPVYKRREYGHAKISATYSTPALVKSTHEVHYREQMANQPMNPHFQRQDWFRRKSNLRRGFPVGTKPQNTNGKMESSHGLCRSASEESLLHHHSNSTSNSQKRPALHGKGRAPPPPQKNTLLPQCKRSQSQPHLPEAADRSYDSSTLSDDDSTPHVSRSNSRGKDFVLSAPPSSNMPYDIQSQHALSARAKQLYQESLRIYQEESLHAHATPVRVESEENSNGGESPLCSTLKRSSNKQQQQSTPSTPHRFPRKHQTVMRVSKDESVQTELRSAGPCERRGRALRRSGWNNSQRSKSLPPMGSDGESDCEINSKEQSSNYVDPSLRHEISWCVSELRALYDRPPPYRPPPHPHPCLIPAYRAPITNYHLGNSQSELYVTKQLLSGKNSATHSHSDSTDESNCGEESYV